MFQTRSHFSPTWFFFSSQGTQRLCLTRTCTSCQHSPAVPQLCNISVLSMHNLSISPRTRSGCTSCQMFPSMLPPGCWQWTVPLFTRLCSSLGLGEMKLNPTAHPPAPLPVVPVHTECSLLIRGTAPALPHRSCSGIRLHGRSTPTPLDQTEIGKHREDLCCLSNHSEHAHGHGGCAKQQAHPESMLWMGWLVRTRLKTTCLIQGLKSAQLNSHPHTKEQKPREATSAPSKEPASLHPWGFLLGACSWGHEGPFISGGFCSCLVQHPELPAIFSALI